MWKLMLSFFTQATFLENKIYTEKRVNYDKLHSKLPNLRVKSEKIYTGQKKFTAARGAPDKYKVCQYLGCTENLAHYWDI